MGEFCFQNRESRHLFLQGIFRGKPLSDKGLCKKRTNNNYIVAKREITKLHGKKCIKNFDRWIAHCMLCFNQNESNPEHVKNVSVFV